MEEVFFLARYEVLVVKYIILKRIRVTFSTVHNATRFLCRFENNDKVIRIKVWKISKKAFLFRDLYLNQVRFFVLMVKVRSVKPVFAFNSIF